MGDSGAQSQTGADRAVGRAAAAVDAAAGAVAPPPREMRSAEIEVETGDKLEQSSSVRLKRTLSVDQMFWFPRFQPPLRDNSLALVLDDNYANLCCSLAEHYTRVLCLHPDAEYLAQARRQVAERGVDNVDFARLDIDALLAGEPPARGADALFALRPASILAALDRPLRADRLLAALLAALADDATVLVADNNARSFRRAFDLRGRGAQRAALGEATRALQRAGFSAEEFVMRAGYTRDFIPAPAWVRRDCVLDAEPLKASLPARLQQHLLGTRPMTRYWPSWAIFAARGSVALRQFDDFVRDEKLRVFCRWEKFEPLQIKRLIAGNPGVTVMLAGAVGDASRDVVIRLPRSRAGHDSASANARALRELGVSAMRDYAPALLASGIWRGHEYFVEEKMPGREIGFRGPRADVMTGRGCREFVALQARDARREVLDADGYGQLIGRHIDALGKFCPGRAGALLVRADRALRARLIGRELPLVRKHGDFKLGNLLFDGDGHLRALIDWDGSEPLGLPLADFFTLVTYNHKDERGASNFLALNREVSVAWAVRDFYRRLLGELSEILGVDADLLPPLRCAACLISLQLRLDWTIKSHESWADELADGVLRDMVRLLEAGVEPN